MQKFKTLFLNEASALFTVSVVANLLLLFSYHEKSYLLVYILYGLLLALITKTKPIAILLSLLLFSLPFEHGLRSFTIPILNPAPFDFFKGYAFYFGFSLKLVLSLVLALYLAFTNLNLKINKDHLLVLSGLLAWVCSLLASTAASAHPESWLGFIKLSVSILVFISFYIAINTHQYHLKNIIAIVTASVVVQSLVAVVQGILGHHLGLFLEDNLLINAYTTDGFQSYRTAGLMGHPTFFGTFLAMHFLLSLIFLIRLKLPTPITLTIVGLELVALYGTQSRSAWFGVALVSALVIYRFKIKLKKSALYFLLLLSLLALPRFYSSLFFFSNPPGIVRIELIKNALAMITTRPLLGTGMNSFTANLTTQNQLNTIRSYAYPVHNSLLLLAVENGIPNAVLFLGFLITACVVTWKKVKNNLLLTALFLTVPLFLFSSLVHPLMPQDSSFEYCLLWLACLLTYKPATNL